jgi:hypothetical protein
MVYSMVVGEGRRVWRWGGTVSMLPSVWSDAVSEGLRRDAVVLSIGC